MSDDSPNQPRAEDLPEIAVEKPRGFSIVWLIPLVAALIGAWLAYTTLTEMGPTVKIIFTSGEGLEAGKTMIKYKGLDVGKVEKLEFLDLEQIQATAKLDKGTEPYLTENTQFWVVRPRVGLGGISGLETLVSGAYIEMDVGMTGTPTKEFIGLDKPPAVTACEAGNRFTLRAEDLGSLSVQSPIYFRDIQVGEVVDYELAEDHQGVLIDIFVHAPHHLRVLDTSRFWKVSGLEISADAEGFKVKMESLASLIAGGLAFDTPVTAGGSAKPSKSGTVFRLFEGFQEIGESLYVYKTPYLLYFEGSVRGLQIGAPVEFRGIKIGSVTDIAVDINHKTLDIRIPVVIEIEPERVSSREIVKAGIKSGEKYRALPILVERGLRAQLKTGSLLTGQLFLELDFYPDLPPAKVNMTGKYPEIPTVPSTMDTLRRSVTDVLTEIRNLPLDKIAYELLETLEGANRFANSPELIESVETLNQTLKEIQKLARDANRNLGVAQEDIQKLTRNVDQEVESLASSAKETLAVARNAMKIADPNSPAAVNLANALKELSDAARSIRVLAEYLERHPEALVHGKGGQGG